MIRFLRFSFFFPIAARGSGEVHKPSAGPSPANKHSLVHFMLKFAPF